MSGRKYAGNWLRFIPITAIAIILISGCNVTPIYQSVTSDEKATLHFTSPDLNSGKPSTASLVLYIFEANEQCELATKGQLKLELNSKQHTVFIPAKKRAYVSLVFTKSYLIGGSSLTSRASFAFTPENLGEYTISAVTAKNSFGPKL